MELTATDVAGATGGSVIGDPSATADGFTMDSRLVEPGQGFVALRAGRDGHDFVADAARRGAGVALVERPVEGAGAIALVRVEDTWRALGELGRLARHRLPGATVVGITGSVGKTTTKDLTAAALGSARRVHASPGSFNNESGVPLTLLGAPEATDVVVLEMGARALGNIAYLAGIAAPEIGIVTQVGMAHAGELGGRAGVAAVKGELVEALPDDGLAILRDDCPSTPELARRSRARVLRVGTAPTADVVVSGEALDAELRPRGRVETPWGAVEVRLEMRGRHQLVNAAMALTVAAHLGVALDEAASGLAGVGPARQRMQVLRTPGGVVVLDDAYKTSPTGAAAALDALADLPVTGRRIAVLGEMLELGEYGPREHAALGALAARRGLDVVVAVGPGTSEVTRAASAGGVEVIDVPDAAAAAAVVVGLVASGDAVLVKASRAVALETVVDAVVRGAAT